MTLSLVIQLIPKNKAEIRNDKTNNDSRINVDGASNISGEEQRFSQLAAHIESILLRLLAELQILETQQTARDRLREQVSQLGNRAARYQQE